ncbi:sensor histidine kinase [Nocardioides seonyuensis]|uniref:histidine kinase n=1 Tax=Nocardioides seonyuensis TaxID=2518371 RepID=A0A4P7IF44_9ACTN|nr:sensor histidine kinase [Nocardioides seonyuensis]QBX54597.1 sensor histidine kinase [Nocardioides seonyuensis]
MSQSREVVDPLPWVGVAASTGLAVLAAVALLPTGLDAVVDGGTGGWVWTLATALVGLHTTLLPPLSTRWPMVAFGIGSACMLVLVVAPDLGGTLAAESGGGVAPVLLPSGLVWFVLLYGVSARLAAPWPSIALAVGMGGCLLVVVRLWEFADAGGATMGPWVWRLLLPVSLVGGVLAAWALGRYRATRRAWTAALADRAAAEERRRIAREMHDVVAHSLAVVVAQAEGGRMLASTQPDRAPEILDAIAHQGREALDQMRGLLGILRSGDAGDDAGAEPPQPGVADLPALVAQVRASGLDVVLETFGDPRPLGPAHSLTAYRVVQESLTNVVKHAGRQAAARITVDWTAGLTLTITDDGRVPDRATTGGRGLRGMRERVEAVGGDLVSGPVPEGGWRTCAKIPA